MTHGRLRALKHCWCTVVAGGFLEIRFLRLLSGKGQHIERPGFLPLDLKLGTVALVELGGRFTATGCVFWDDR